MEPCNHLQAGFASPELQSFVPALACLSVLYFLLPKLPRGLPRALCVFPCFPILARVPFSVRSPILRAVSSFMFLWLCPSKLLLRCWDVIPDYPGDGLLYFLCTSIMPARVKGRSDPDGSNAASAHSLQGIHDVFLRLFQVLLLSAFVKVSAYAPRSGWFHHALYCLILYVALQWVLCVISGLVSLLLRLELHPFFHKPFLSSSLSDFWGKRWNCLASYMLRETVYMPTLKFLSKRSREHGTPLQSSHVKLGNENAQMHFSKSSETCGKWGNDEKRELQQKADTRYVPQNAGKVSLTARAVAMLASFIASGLIHELIFCCITQSHPTGEVTLFFILNGAVTMLEVCFRRTFSIGRKLPNPIPTFFTLLFLYVSSAWLFMPPIVRSGTDVRILAEFSWMQDVVVNLFSGSQSSRSRP